MIPSTEQQAIIEHDAREHGRVLAGPGTGKSFASVGLLDRLITQEPGLGVGVLTFTRAATQELASKFEEAGLKLAPSTIHSFALALLVHHLGQTPLPSPLRIPDGYETDAIQTDIGERLRSTGYENVTKREVAKLERELSAGWESLDPDLVLLADIDPELRNRYLATWRDHRDIFGYTLLAELPFRAVNLLEDHEPHIESLDFLIVDEFQDLNKADLRLLSLLGAHDIRILAIGDDDQSIYGFRMAAPHGIRTFLDDYGAERDYPLTICFRCGADILSAATTVIETAADRPAKPRLEPHDPDRPGWYAYGRFRSHVAEAKGVADMVRARIDQGIPPGEIIVLVRSQLSNWVDLLGPKLERRGVDFVDTGWVFEALGDARFRSALCLLRIAVNREDSLAWWVLLTLTRGISEAFRDYLYDHARGVSGTYGRALLELAPDFSDAPNQRSADKARKVIERTLEHGADIAAAAEDPDLGEAGWGGWIIEQLGDDRPGEDACIMLRQVGEFLGSDTDLGGFLGQLEPTAKDLATQSPAVRIMTMTNSKGLTVDSAFVMGVERGIVPHARADDLEEERRLLYVALTRATELCVLTFAKQRTGPTARHGRAHVARSRGRSPLLEDLEIGRWRPGEDVVTALQAGHPEPTC